MAKRSFEAWMKAVDSHLLRLVGVESSDMSDVCYADWYEDGMSPSQAARRAMRCESGEDW